MALRLHLLCLSLFVLSVSACKRCSIVHHRKEFLSPAFTMEPGDVRIKDDEIDFPAGDIGVNRVQGEVVDHQGNPIPLSEVYVHHWTMSLSQQKKGSPTVTVPGNNGICPDTPHFFGAGAETRNFVFNLPDPYAMHVGDPKSLPPGYKYVWIFQLHAISLQGTEDHTGCSECLCELYNVTRGGEGYVGGYDCCIDGDKCKVKDGYVDTAKKTYHFKYTIEWVDWDDECVRPARSYMFDLTDTGDRDPNGPQPLGCQIEHQVDQCDKAQGECISVLENRLVLPQGGHVVYISGHQHQGGLGLAVFGENGRHLCTSHPRYGTGAVTDAGNEGGFLVAMSACEPQLGSVSVKSNEKLYFVSKYNSTERHTGVMSIILMLVVDEEISIKNPQESEIL